MCHRKPDFDVIDVVAAGIARSFVVGRGFEGDGTGRGIDVEQGRISPRDRIGQRCSGIRICRSGGVNRARAVLGKAGRCGRGDGRRFVDVRDGDGDSLGGCQGAIGSADRDVIDVVAARIARSFVVWRGFEGDSTGRGIDIEQGSVSTGDRIGQRCAGIGIGRGSSINRAGAILGKAGRGSRGDGWSFVDICDGDGDSLGGCESAIGSRDLDVIDVVAAGIARSFIVGRRFEGDSTSCGIDVEQGSISAGDRIGQRCSGIRVGGGSGINCASSILGKACRCSRGDCWRFIDVCDSDGNGFGGTVGAVRRRDVDVIDIVAAGIARRFVVRRRFECDRTSRGINIEQGSVGTRDGIGQRCSGIRVGRGGGINRARTILGKAGSCSRSDSWALH